MQLFAQVNNQGTAMAETAVCHRHLETHRRHFELDYSEILGREDGFRKIPLEDATWHDCTDNDALACNVCGATGSSPDLVGQTIVRVEYSATESEFGEEPTTILHFADGTSHGFVHPSEA